MNALAAKIETLSTSQIKDAIVLISTDNREGADTAMNELLTALETRIEETEFCQFCESIYP